MARVAILDSCQSGHVQQTKGLAGEVSVWGREAGEALDGAGGGALLEGTLLLCRGPCPLVSFSLLGVSPGPIHR